MKFNIEELENIVDEKIYDDGLTSSEKLISSCLSGRDRFHYEKLCRDTRR